MTSGLNYGRKPLRCPGRAIAHGNGAGVNGTVTPDFLASALNQL
jgi:hypothetical protein